MTSSTCGCCDALEQDEGAGRDARRPGNLRVPLLFLLLLLLISSSLGLVELLMCFVRLPACQC